MPETSTKPYLLRAIYEWCTDNGFTPYLAVMVDMRTRVPMQFVKNGEIVLNISFDATSGLKMSNELVQFNARFSGVSREISVPVENVIAIYARENGQGMAFDVARPDKSDANRSEDAGSASGQDAPPNLTSVPTSSNEQMDKPDSDTTEDGSDPSKKGGRPTLTRIK